MPLVTFVWLLSADVVIWMCVQKITLGGANVWANQQYLCSGVANALECSDSCGRQTCVTDMNLMRHSSESIEKLLSKWQGILAYDVLIRCLRWFQSGQIRRRFCQSDLIRSSSEVELVVRCSVDGFL